jgi:dienelactone hydrolase
LNKLLVGLVIVLVCSIIANVLVFSFYVDKYSISELFERFLNKNIEKELQLPKIPDFYEENILLLNFEKNVKNKEDFVKWKPLIYKKFIEIYDFKNIDKPTLKNVKVESTKNIDSNILTKFSAKAFDGDEIIFYELKPNYEFESLQTVFIIPGSGNQGAADVLGLDTKYKDYFYHKNIGKKLVNEGYVVYVIENRGWGERTIDAGLHCDEPNVYCSGNVLSRHLSNSGKDLFTLQISDSLQVFDFIKNKKYVDSDNIAVMGLSLGGGIVQSMGIIQSDIKSIIIASGLVSYDKAGGTGITPGMLEFFDFPDVVASLAPKPIYLSWGEYEKSNFRFEVETSYSANIVKKAYSIMNAEQNIVVIFHNDEFNQGHTFDVNSIIRFLNDTIGEPRI